MEKGFAPLLQISISNINLSVLCMFSGNDAIPA